MNFGELKELIQILRAGDKVVPKSDFVLISLVQEAMKEVAKKTNPLVLVTPLHQEIKVIKNIEQGLYIKEPRKIVDDETLIEIDEELIQAVAHSVISSFVSSDNLLKHKTHVAKIINDYNWERYESFKDNPDLLSLSRKAIDFQGFKKIYFEKNKSLNGYWYVWDYKFVFKFDRYLAKGLVKLSKSDVNNINLFIKYADNELTIEHEEYENIKEFDKYLGGIKDEPNSKLYC